MRFVIVLLFDMPGNKLFFQAPWEPRLGHHMMFDMDSCLTIHIFSQTETESYLAPQAISKPMATHSPRVLCVSMQAPPPFPHQVSSHDIIGD